MNTLIRAAMLASLLGCVAVSIHAESASDESESRLRQIQLPAGDLLAAVETLARESDEPLVYQPEHLKGTPTAGLSGVFSTQDAIRELLKGTKLRLSVDASTGVMMIAPVNSPVKTTAAGGGMVDAASLRLAQADQPAPSEEERSDDKNPETSAPAPEKELKTGIAEMLVQGSKVTNADVKRGENDVQPYYIFDSTEIQQSAANNIHDFLKQRLTMNTVSTTEAQRYFSAYRGAPSTINLRGLGSNETLILIDGRRSAKVQNVQYSTGQSDVNSIPMAAIERIEVLPTSASAIYGGEALGGVINVIMKKQYKGGMFTYGRESPIDTNAPINRINAGYGFSLGEDSTNVMLSGGYSEGTAPVAGDRDNLFQRGIKNIVRNDASFLYSSSKPFLGATPNIASADGSNLVLKDGAIQLNSPITFVPAGAEPGLSIDSAFVANAGNYNLNLSPGTGQYGLSTELGTVPRTKSLMASIRREMSARLDAFVEMSIASTSMRSFYNPFSDNSYVVSSTAPNNPFQQAVRVTIPSTIAPLQRTNNEVRSLTAGIVAHLSNEWSAGLDYTVSRNSFDGEGSLVDSASFSAALDSGDVNPFVDTVAHPLNLSMYLTPFRLTGDNFLDNVGLRASGSLGSFSWGQPTLTVGLEHRHEGFDGGKYTVDYPLTPAQNLAMEFFKNAQKTSSVYVETNIPVVTKINAMALVRALDLQVAARSERYTIDAKTPFAYLSPDIYIPFNPPQGVGTTSKFTSTNPTIGIKYKPVDDVTVRASYAKAFLPPTAAQILIDPAPGLPDDITDPDTGETYSVNTFGVGNPDLNPQTSKAISLGVIFEPQDGVLTGLRINLERYDIVQPDYITKPLAAQVIADPAYANRVTRDPTTGRITDVDVSYVNALEYKTAGWDLSLSYTRAFAAGTYRANFAGTHIDYDKRQYLIGRPFVNYDGFPGEQGEVKNKANLTMSWERNGLVLGCSTTYYGSYYQAYSPGSPLDIQYDFNGSFTYYTAPQGSDSIPSQVYHDLIGSFAFDESLANQGSGKIHNILSGLVVQFGIKNILNTAPPFDVNLLEPFYVSPFGDVRLRSYIFSATKSF